MREVLKRHPRFGRSRRFPLPQSPREVLRPLDWDGRDRPYPTKRLGQGPSAQKRLQAIAAPPPCQALSGEPLPCQPRVAVGRTQNEVLRDLPVFQASTPRARSMRRPLGRGLAGRRGHGGTTDGRRNLRAQRGNPAFLVQGANQDSYSVGLSSRPRCARRASRLWPSKSAVCFCMRWKVSKACWLSWIFPSLR